MSSYNLFLASHASLKKVLLQIKGHPAFKNSPELRERITTALLLHHEASAHLQGLLADHEAARKELSRLTREDGEKI